jgi:hypothetical protein
MENLRIDENSRWVLGAVANDGSGNIKNARVNPITGALIVEATVTSTNTQIGSTIPGGTAGSVLFLGLGGTLAQDNTNFFYDDTNNYLGIGTSTPNATLDVQGTAIITGSAGTPTFVLGRDGSGNISNIVLGSNLTLTGGVLSANTSGSGYNQIQDNGTNITQRTTLNFVDYFTVTDGSGKTNVSINTAELGADATLISTLETNMDLANISGQIDLTTQVTGLLPAANIDITNLESNLDLANIAGQIDLTTQVTGQLSPTNIDLLALASDTTFIAALEPNLDLANLGGDLDLATQVIGVLPLANGGTGQALTDPNYDAVYVWDNTTNTTRLAQLSGLSYNSGTNTLSSSGGNNTYTVNADESSTTYMTNQIRLDLFSGVGVASGMYYLSGTASGGSNFSSNFLELFGSVPSNNITTLSFNNTKILKLKTTVSPYLVTDGSAIFFGLSNTAVSTVLNTDITNTGNNKIGIVINITGGVYTVYSVVCDGTNITANVLSGITFTNTPRQFHMFDITWEPGTGIKFYVDGILKNTVTTNIPTSTQFVKFGISGSSVGGLGNATIDMNIPVISQEI